MKSRIIKLFAIILTIAIIGIIGVIVALELDYRRPKTKSDWVNKYPQSNLSLAVFDINLPEGWGSIVNPEYDLNNHPELISVYTELFDEHRKAFPINEFPTAQLFLGQKTEEAFLRTYIGKLLIDANSPRKIIEVDGRELILYRYEGDRMICTYGPNAQKTIKTDMPSITIGIASEFGFYASFWGLKEHEPIFIEMINSIKWNKTRDV
ncbi:MAG: hypothetical protein JW806_07625 [Sedimentisphaerales bacterium]|nr:hypothetical protein [Sedimentisphaerales bacterium]